MQTRMLSVITVWCKIAVHCYLGEEGTQIVTLCVFLHFLVVAFSDAAQYES